uniref:Uncharacterized protein n=1 Tax=Romanomermis culicivorax TaxID=13658 RepID=A0A915IDN9_ROMCU
MYCDDNVWEKYFGQTFDAYNRTWKFQRKYSTRTSNVTYLMEAFSFYSAIRSRGYYSTASKELKYDTNFGLVELNGEVDEFVHIYGSSEDELEWTVVINEALDFANADNCLSIVDMDTVTVVLSHRMSVFNCISSSDWNINGQLWLNQAIIIGSKLNQVKFSELTIDMYHILQTLEREISQETIKLMGQDSTSSSSPVLFDHIKGDNGQLKENPNKILLYKPTIETVFLCLSLSMKKQTMNSVVLLYLSADGVPDLNCNEL